MQQARDRRAPSPISHGLFATRARDYTYEPRAKTFTRPATLVFSSRLYIYPNASLGACHSLAATPSVFSRAARFHSRPVSITISPRAHISSRNSGFGTRLDELSSRENRYTMRACGTERTGAGMTFRYRVYYCWLFAACVWLERWKYSDGGYNWEWIIIRVRIFVLEAGGGIKIELPRGNVWK